MATKNGYGRHQDTIPRNEFLALLEIQFFQSVIEASFAFGFLKISIALSLLRLGKGNWYKWILWALIGKQTLFFRGAISPPFHITNTPPLDGNTGFTCIYTLFAFATFLTFCKPIAAQWNRSVKAKCYSKELYRDFGLFNTACNIFTDVLFATLPIPLIWSLQLQRRIRVYLIAILSGGYIAVAVGIARAVFIISFVHQRDGTFYPWAPFFASLQLHLGIVAACAPTLRPLLGRTLRLTNAGVGGGAGGKNLPRNYNDANYYRAGKALDRLPLSFSVGLRRGPGTQLGSQPSSSGGSRWSWTGTRRASAPGRYNYLGGGHHRRPSAQSAEFVEMLHPYNPSRESQKWTTIGMMGGAGRDGTGFSAVVHHQSHSHRGSSGGHRKGSLAGLTSLTSSRDRDRDMEKGIIGIHGTGEESGSSDEILAGKVQSEHIEQVHTSAGDPEFKGIVKTMEIKVEK